MENLGLLLEASGVIGWTYLAWRVKHGTSDLLRRLRWALWPKHRGRDFAHRSGRPGSRVAHASGWPLDGGRFTRAPAVHVDKTTGEIWEA